MRKPVMVTAAVLALTVASAALASDIYKWVDEDGNVHYSDMPLAANSERLSIESRPTDPSRVSAETKAISESRSAARERRDARQAGAEEQAELRAEAEKRAEQCSSARATLQRFITSRRAYREDENGERVYLDDAERQAARQRVEDQITEYCSG